MGNEICCSLENTTNKFRGDLYKVEAFEIADPLSSDPIIQKWISENSNYLLIQNQTLIQPNKMSRVLINNNS